MTGAERGYLLLCSQLGDPARHPLTTAQFRRLARRVREAERVDDDRELTSADLLPLGYGPEEAERIVSLLSEEDRLDHYLARGKNYGCVPLTWLSAGYPARLRQTLGDDAPACLWLRGDAGVLETPGVALVGSRDLHPANREFACLAGEEAAKQGFSLISGNARGADQTAQNAAIAAGGCVISFVADKLTDHVPVPQLLYISEDSFDLDFSPQRALSRNRCIHALGTAAIAAKCSYQTGGTWDGSVKNLRFGWSPLYVFDDGSESASLLAQMGAEPIGTDDLKDLRTLPRPAQQML